MFHLRTLVVVLFAAFVWATTTTDVQNDLNQTDTDVKGLITLLNSYTGTGSQTVQVRNKINALKADLSKATSDTNAVTGVTAANASPIFSYACTSPLYPDVSNALNLAVQKKSAFQASGSFSEFCGYLNDLRVGTDNLAAALIAKAPSGTNLGSQGTTCRANYAARFSAAKTGLGC